jgi:hypothetical protein
MDLLMPKIIGDRRQDDVIESIWTNSLFLTDDALGFRDMKGLYS